MTREDASFILANIDRRVCDDELNEALDMAIKALEQEPCDDVVSRAEVFEIMGNLMSIPYDFDRPINDDDVSESMDKIKALPSVTPTRKKGKWIGHREHCENLGVIPSGLGAYEWCSNCDCGIDVREWHRNHYNYCPNCGSFMMEED